MRKWITGAWVLLLSYSLHAQEPREGAIPALDATAGNQAVQINYLSGDTFQHPRSGLDYGLLLSDQRDLVGSAAWMFNTNLNFYRRLSFQIGPKAYLAKLAQGNEGAFAIALAGDLRYELLRRPAIAAYGQAAYAPRVLMFGTPTGISDFTAGVQVRFAPRLYALAGYRWFNFRYPSGPDDRIQNGLFFGMKWDMK